MKYTVTITIKKDNKTRKITKFFSENATIKNITDSVKNKVEKITIKEIKNEFDWIDELEKDLNNI